MMEQLLTLLLDPQIQQLIGVSVTVAGALVGIRHYKTRFNKLVKLLVRIDAAWSDDIFTDPEIKDIIDAALDFAGKTPQNPKPGV